MKKTRFSEEQIIAVLREQEGGMKTADVCRKHGISSATLYAWKAKYRGMDVSQARKLKVLEEENGRLKRASEDVPPIEGCRYDERARGRLGLLHIRPVLPAHAIAPIVFRNRERATAKNSAPMTVIARNCGQTTSRPAPR